ncbi:NAD(P)-dependent dehydrogenase (short-subunit alcohol dehydrogenase family) [Microbacterium halimionae]|uniref:NAD(P)-dependent dehydrogenase (Short-subunit alcohol dehydrogenase family) n=1 Tax=Microbacterium halimionae TaxID=1526413 RepID=A0A7W3JR62_9MICO|nr:SDR family oxidoreductase [Microbacterium halimionae]MBA8817510.1 NAD(P)-dependent dehydrogenase (short-subunit alcohol dehydrogenase family) [Microbacterium halimionae]NII95047.1 NAD(P)-dependent dehydrogenase (short-subunit alcohol dehydrogenase family) [Microbacterium halimionae]
MKSNEEELASLTTDARLAGQTALVTGSSSGIGEAIARVLAASGAEVIVSGRDAGRTQAVVTMIEQAGGTASALVADLGASPADVRHFASEALALAGGRIDILVNNAGIYPATATADLSDDDLDAVLAINIRAPHVLVAALAPTMAERGSGSVVNIGSWMARVGLPFGAIYTASKAALEQMTRTWAAEYGPRGVSVNTVAPGATSTPGNAESADVLAAMTAVTVAGRPVRPVDVAYAVRFLVSGEASFIRGAVVDVDGGIAHTRLS